MQKSLVFPHVYTCARIINMSSGVGHIKHLSKEWKDSVLNPDLTEEGLTKIIDQFVA